MKHGIEYAGCLAALVFATACGGGGGGKKADVNQQAAKTAAQQTISAATTAVEQNNGEAAAFQFLGAAQAGQGIITPPQGGTAQGTCSCDETAMSCNFTDCAQGANSLSGTISWGGGNVVCDLTFVVTSPVAPLNMSTTCDLNVTDTSMSGSLSSSGSLMLPEGAGASGNVSWSVDAVYNDVTISGGSPTGGSVTVDAEYEAAGEKFSGNGTVNFP